MIFIVVYKSFFYGKPQINHLGFIDTGSTPIIGLISCNDGLPLDPGPGIAITPVGMHPQLYKSGPEAHRSRRLSITAIWVPAFQRPLAQNSSPTVTCTLQQGLTLTVLLAAGSNQRQQAGGWRQSAQCQHAGAAQGQGAGVYTRTGGGEGAAYVQW